MVSTGCAGKEVQAERHIRYQHLKKYARAGERKAVEYSTDTFLDIADGAFHYMHMHAGTTGNSCDARCAEVGCQALDSFFVIAIECADRNLTSAVESGMFTHDSVGFLLRYTVFSLLKIWDRAFQHYQLSLTSSSLPNFFKRFNLKTKHPVSNYNLTSRIKKLPLVSTASL